MASKKPHWADVPFNTTPTGRQETIISLEGNVTINRDESKEFGGQKGKGCLRILSDSETEDVVIYIPLPGNTTKAHEIVINKALLKVYVKEIK
jgi:hypothetical protein